MSRPLLKYCGIRSNADLGIVSESIADYIGFIFAESKRKVEPEQVKTWLKKTNIGSKKIVGVFVNPEYHELENALYHLPIHVIQFHGNEPVEQIAQIKETFKGDVWKALHHHPQTLEEMAVYNSVVDGFVIDSRIKGQWGGTGVSFDWNAVPKYIEFAALNNKYCFIAGGVNEFNMKELLSYKPYGIDLSSGIEENNRKSKDRILKVEERVLEYANISR